MALTDHCDLYVAVNEAAINRVIQHVVRQRPSLVNHGSDGLARRPDLLCTAVDAHPGVTRHGNPLVRTWPDIPLVFTDGSFTVEYAAQLAAEVDFHPNDVVHLPPELDPLGTQRFAVRLIACAGIGCPRDAALGALAERMRAGEGPRRPKSLPFEELDCFCLEFFVVGGVDFEGLSGDQHLLGTLDGVEIVDLEPEGLENALECYAKAVARLALIQKLRAPVIRFIHDQLGLGNLTIEPTVSAALPNNPSITDDELRVYLSLSAVPGTWGTVPTAPPGLPRARVRHGAFDATAAISENGLEALFGALRDTVDITAGDITSHVAVVRARYELRIHLEGGELDLRADGSIRVRELDVLFDTLKFCVSLHIPTRTLGGGCIALKPIWYPVDWSPNPGDPCLLYAPSFSLFSADPDLEVCLDLGGIVRSEASITGVPTIKYSVDPGRTTAMDDWDARAAGLRNCWQLFLDAGRADVDPLDIPDMVGDLLEGAVDLAVDGMLGTLPQWQRDLVKAYLGNLIDVVREILDFGDDASEWIEDTFNVTLGIKSVLDDLIVEQALKRMPLFEIDDPIQILGPDGNLIPVLLPMEYVEVAVDDDELVLSADLGD